MRKIKHQGEMDGLCGVYALVNAIISLAGQRLSEKDGTDLFKELIRSIYRRNNRKRKEKPITPIEFIWDGASTRDISYMLKETMKFLGSKSSPNNVDQYWKRLEEAFNDSGGQKKCVAIIDYNWQIDSNKEEGHWTCVTKVTENILFLHDSIMSPGAKLKKIYRSRCTLGNPTSRRPYRLFAHNVSLLRFNDAELS